MCARRSGCGFLTNKEVYCNQHTSLVQEAVRVTANDMRVDHCVIIHTDNNEKVGRKITKLVSPDLVKVLTGSLCLLSLGSLTSLSDTVHSNLLVSHQFSSRAYFWSTKSPHERTPYTLTISANLPEHEPLPLYATPTNPSTLPTSPEDINWPCVTTEVGGRCGLWTSLSPTNHTSSINHSILKAAYAILKVGVVTHWWHHHDITGIWRASSSRSTEDLPDTKESPN
jgi:histone-lysine N-methyltransferase MLL4